MKTLVGSAIVAATLLSLACTVPEAVAADPVTIGHLADYSGPTSDAGVPFGQAMQDATAYLNTKPGVPVKLDTVDYGYQAPRAVTQYKKWSSGDRLSLIHGWGTADTEALVGFVTKDKVLYFSGSYAAQLADPEGKGPRGSKPAPYTVFYGPSYSDALRALVSWAAQDWKAKGNGAKPKYVHMGANHPYPNSPKDAGEEMARSLGFEVLPPIQFALVPGDYTAQCLTLKESGANYAYLGNTAGSNISVLKACHSVGANVQFLGNVWGMDENAMKAASKAADGVVFALRTLVPWGGEAPGMVTVRAVSRMSDPTGETYRPVHYLAALCNAFLAKEAVDWAAANGGVTGPNLKTALYHKKGWVPAGLEGVCLPVSWSPDDHRPTMTVPIYRARVDGDTSPPVGDLVRQGVLKLEKLDVITLPRRKEWLGW